MQLQGPIDRFGEQRKQIDLAPDWTIGRLGNGARMLGANGMRPGPDGRLYIAQCVGSQISALNVDDGSIETIVPVSANMIGPDDLAFDSHGTMFVTEAMGGRVTARAPNGQIYVVAGDIPSANGISIHGDRMFVDEFRSGGRMWEMYRDGTAPRLIADNLQFPNALALADDGYIYFPSVLAGEIWRVDAAGGEPERFIGDLASPVAVKFDGQGRLVVVNAGTGDVVRIDRQQRSMVTLSKTRPGLDNLAFTADGRLFVSNFTDGGVSELLANGDERELVAPALLGPWGIALDHHGMLYVADGLSLVTISPAGQVGRLGTALRGSGWPGFVKNVAVRQDGAIYIANSTGALSLYQPNQQNRVVASGLGEITGLALLPDGSVLACDAKNGSVVQVSETNTITIARNIGRPSGIAVDSMGALFVSDAAGGRLAKLENDNATTLADGFIDPQGVAIHAGHAYIVDRGDRSIHEVALNGSGRRKIASGLPLGSQYDTADAEKSQAPIKASHSAFSGLVCDAAGRIFVSADGDGSILVLDRIVKTKEGL